MEEIKRRRDLQKELAGEGENWRMEFLALGEKNRSQTADGKMVNGKMKKIDSAAVMDAMQKVSKMEVPAWFGSCLLYTSPSPRDGLLSRMPSSA